MPSLAQGNSKNMPVTSAAEVRHLAGPLNDDVVAAVLKIGPSLEELEMAASYARGEGDLIDRAGHPLTGRLAQVYEILSAEAADEEERAALR
jgi:hypothetical protein